MEIQFFGIILQILMTLLLTKNAKIDLAAKLLAIKYKLKRGFPLEENDWLYGEDIACLSWEQRKTRLEECLIQSWQNRWDDDSEPGRVTHRFIPYVTLAYRDPKIIFPKSFKK